MILKSDQDMVIQCYYVSIASWCETCTYLITESNLLALGGTGALPALNKN